MIERQRLGGAWCPRSSERYTIGSLGLEEGVAYHLDGALTVIVDGGPAKVGGR